MLTKWELDIIRNKNHVRELYVRLHSSVCREAPSHQTCCNVGDHAETAVSDIKALLADIEGQEARLRDCIEVMYQVARKESILTKVRREE
jgi:hypothetical protein